MSGSSMSQAGASEAAAVDVACVRNYHARMDDSDKREADGDRLKTDPLPTLFLGHGAPPLLEDEGWMTELRSWAAQLPRPERILIISAHWQSAPVAISATRRVPLVYDFYGFPEHYYRMTYEAPGAPELAVDIRKLLPRDEPVQQLEDRGLDHGAWVPLKAMFPAADIPVLQMSMPDLDPTHLLALGRRLAPLRDEGTLIIGSGFMTHGLPFIHEYMGHTDAAPAWSVEFDRWAAEALARGDLDELLAFRERAPGMPYAHPTVEHFAPLFVALGASTNPDEAPETAIEGFWWGLSKRAFQTF
jgi:4,5-DOPA dioxygenase extradiol